MRKSCSRCSSSFLSALQTSQVLHISMNAQMNAQIIFFFARDLFADATSVHNSNMKHARAIEFD